MAEFSPNSMALNRIIAASFILTTSPWKFQVLHASGQKTDSENKYLNQASSKMGLFAGFADRI
ncbi:MAG: hypothetical protein CMN97_06090 [Synechococcus sp. NAT40]|nr:hypothetical protein [Synechococcus sp. NAT40]